MPRLTTLIDIASSLGVSMEEIFSEGNAVVATCDVIELHNENERLLAENSLIIAENAMLKDKVAALTGENDILRIKLEHKEEIISLHNYYNALLKNSGR